MKRDQIIRAWKDEEYRSGLSESELSALPKNPAGIVELTSDEMEEAGGHTSIIIVGLPTIQTCDFVCPITPLLTTDYRCN
jgi:mersacidin/lichenicidin family type 2 lantibiotic